MSKLATLPSRAHRPAALLTLALAGLVAACNFGPGATTPPTSPPTNPPGPTSTPGPTPTPAPTPAPSFGVDQIEHPTGANDIVLRMEQGGGHMIFGFTLTAAPQFTLYGDGKVIFQQVDTRGVPFGEVPNLPWLVGQLDEDGVQALLRFALGQGRLANARENYENNMCADCGSTTFVVNAAGMEKVVNIYALFEVPDPGPDQADRAGFSQLSAVLGNFETQDGLGDVTVYEPEVYRVILLEGFGEPVGDPLAWPWDDLTVEDFPVGDEPGGIAHLDAEHVSKLMAVPNGGQFGIWVEDPDGNAVQFAVRPLLPEEQATVETS